MRFILMLIGGSIIAFSLMVAQVFEHVDWSKAKNNSRVDSVTVRAFFALVVIGVLGGILVIIGILEII